MDIIQLNCVCVYYYNDNYYYISIVLFIYLIYFPSGDKFILLLLQLDAVKQKMIPAETELELAYWNWIEYINIIKKLFDWCLVD